MIRKKKQLTTQEATVKVEQMCAVAEYAPYDIYIRLRKWGISEKDTDNIIKKLEENRYIDSSRFARAFTRDKYRFAHWGRMKIRIALAQKKIPLDIITTAFAEGIDEDEYERSLIELLKSKARRLTEGNTYEGRTKLFRFGISRGFESGLITKAIRNGNLFPEVPE